MKIHRFIAFVFLIALSLSGTTFGQTQRFYSVILFMNDVYLSDNTNATLASRIPGGTVLTTVVNSNTATASLTSDGTNIILEVYNWSTIAPVQDIDVSEYTIYGDNGSGDINESASANMNDVRLSGSGIGDVNINAGVHNKVRAKILSDLSLNGDGNDISVQSLNWGFGSGSMDVTGNYNTVRFRAAAGGRALTVKASGSLIHGDIESGPNSSVTNLADSAAWVGHLVNGDRVYITGKGSLNVGAVVNTNDNSIKAEGWITSDTGIAGDIHGDLSNASGTPAHMSATEEITTNFWAYTASAPTASSDAGQPHQIAFTTVNGTNYVAYYIQPADEWYFSEVKTSTAHGF